MLYKTYCSYTTSSGAHKHCSRQSAFRCFWQWFLHDGQAEVTSMALLSVLWRI